MEIHVRQAFKYIDAQIRSITKPVQKKKKCAQKKTDPTQTGMLLRLAKAGLARGFTSR